MNNDNARIEALEQELEAVRARYEAAAQEAEDERDARQAFVSLVTHELRTPLTSIKGYTDLLLKGIMGPVTDAQENFLQTIRSNAERMSGMLADLSDINKIEGERLKLTFEPVEAAPVVEEALKDFRDQAEQKSQTLHVTMPEDVPAVRCDRERLIQILGKLVHNALTYTPEGGTIQVTVGADSEDDRLRVEVRDDGIGIPEDEQDRIFERFFRASDEQTRQTPGNGLSLHLCKQLLALQEGDITFESEQGVGSTFQFTLPLVQD
jgi:signal transduction histidine kinase